MKKAWRKPELVVLVRGKPEEAVLQGCKVEFVKGPSMEFSGCAFITKKCSPCEAMTGS